MKYSTSNIILRIQMSMVNLKIIFVKKHISRHENAQPQGRGATFIYNRNDRFHTRGGLFGWDGLLGSITI